MSAADDRDRLAAELRELRAEIHDTRQLVEQLHNALESAATAILQALSGRRP